MKNLAQRLIIEELFANDPVDTKGRAAFRACEKLRLPLSTLTGNAGYRSLLSRALNLAKTDSPWLTELRVSSSGSLEYSAETQAQFDGEEAAAGGAALLSQLLGLLVTFIGGALTLRLVKNVWPKAALKDFDSGKDQL